MKRILSVAMAAAFAGAMPAVQAQSIPTIEACAKYAEADAVFESAKTEAQDVFRTAERQADATYKAALESPNPTIAALEAAMKKARAAQDAVMEQHSWASSEARKANAAVSEAQWAINEYEAAAAKRARVPLEATMKKAHNARKIAIEDARTVLTQTYLAIYAEGGGTQSDVWDVMVKLLTHQRQLCTEHYGL